MTQVRSIVIITGLAAAAYSGARAQSFSETWADLTILNRLVPWENICLTPAQLVTPVCEPVAELYRVIHPPEVGDRAVVSAKAVLRLCRGRKLRDPICGEAALLELRYHRTPCWQSSNLYDKC